jgi:hypothetical protein
LLIIIAVLVAVTANAAVAGNTSFGLKAGLNFATITDNPTSWDPNMSFKPGIAAGAFVIYGFNDWLSLQPELLYSQRGVTSKLLDYDIVDVDLTASFNYVEIPLLLVYTVPLKGSFRPIFYAGPVLSYMLSSEAKLSASILSVSVDMGSVTHVNDFGGIIGTGFRWDVGNGMVTFDIRYQRGFTNVITTGDFEINGDPQVIEADDIKNQGFAFLLGYVF